MQELRAGEKLSDLRLSTELGVSRTPIREALHQLVQDGVVVAEPNRGFFVASFTEKDLDEIFELRGALELFAIRRLDTTAHREELDRALFELDHVERLLRNASTEEERRAAADAFVKTDRGFHSWLVSTVNNGRLDTIINGLWTQIAIFQQVGATIPAWFLTAVSQHRHMIDLLLADKVDEAYDAVEEHILDMETEVLAFFRSQQQG